MSRYGMAWGDYIPVAERRQKAEKLTAKLRKQGKALAPVVIAGRSIATTFWGKAWCGNLEAYRDYESRLPRGRSYARNGAVIDLKITSGEAHALVSGSQIYKVSVHIEPLPQPGWRQLRADCAGRIDSLVELLQGRFSKPVMERLCRRDGGLFPQPSDIRFRCSCPDHASMCKHVAAVLYGVGARLDQQPDLLFRLRAVDGAELAAGTAADLLPGAKAPAADRVLQTDDMAALFGLDMAEPGEATAQPSVKRLARARGEAPAVVPPPGPVAAIRAAKGVKPDAKPGAPRGGGIVTAVASGLRASGAVAKAAGAPSVKAGRKPGKTADVVRIAAASVRASKALAGKASPRARVAEQASRPPKPATATATATAGHAAPKEGGFKPPRASGTSAAEPVLAVRDRANWSWKALAAARKAKKA